MIEDQELKEIAALNPAGTGAYNFIVGTNDAFTSVNSGSEVIEDALAGKNPIKILQ